MPSEVGQPMQRNGGYALNDPRRQKSPSRKWVSDYVCKKKCYGTCSLYIGHGESAELQVFKDGKELAETPPWKYTYWGPEFWDPNYRKSQKSYLICKPKEHKCIISKKIWKLPRAKRYHAIALEEKRCTNIYGRWYQNDYGTVHECLLPLQDVRKHCTSEKQCIGICIADPRFKKEYKVYADKQWKKLAKENNLSLEVPHDWGVDYSCKNKCYGTCSLYLSYQRYYLQVHKNGKIIRYHR